MLYRLSYRGEKCAVIFLTAQSYT